MKKRRMLHLLGSVLAMAVLLSACAGGEKAPGEILAALPSEPEAPDYPWLAGNSPIPDRRVGLYRQGISGMAGGFDCTESGYYILGGVWSDSGSLYGDCSIVYYGDHGSDTVIMLCGRPDCAHDNEDCNAVFRTGQSIRYIDGHLYVTWVPLYYKPKVTRMDLDGSNQTVAVDLAEQKTDETGLEYPSTPILYGDVLSVSAKKLGQDGEDAYMQFYRKVDDSTDHLIRRPDGEILQDGDTYLLRSDGAVYRWDPDTNETEHLGDVGDGSFGYIGTEEAWSIKDGVIYRLTYASGQETPVLDTGLRPAEGEWTQLSCFPDHLAVRYEYLAADTGEVCVTFYFYNWAFEALGEVTFEGDDHHYIVGETPDRLIFCCASPRSPSVPRYYVDKADFGTGHIEIREFNMPDVDWTATDAKA